LIFRTAASFKRPLWSAQAGRFGVDPKRHHSGKRRAELLRGSIRKRSSMKLKPSWQVGRKARSWMNKNGECLFWVRGFKSRECAEEYQADLFETISDQKEVTGFMIMPAVGRGNTWQLIVWSTDTPLAL
jgi:hypothetical protein